MDCSPHVLHDDHHFFGRHEPHLGRVPWAGFNDMEDSEIFFPKGLVEF